MEVSISSVLDDCASKRATFDLGATKLTVDDAVKCLTGDYNVIVPLPNARPCNNLDEYFHKSTKNVRRTPKNDLNQSTSSMSRTVKKPAKAPREPFSVPLVRNFERILKKADPATVTSPSMPTRPKKARPDLFSKNEQIEANSGPMSHLKARLNQVVKVMIRRRKKVPYISQVIEYKGTLSMFDKHMNMYLRDVIEVFKYERDGNILKRGRHRDGIILRGDNVILVA